MIHSPSERAESTQLSHLFGIAMTAVLITVILTGAADYVQNERADVAQTQLETIGNRLASEVERVDELGRQGGNASARMQVQATVAGENYDVRIGTGSTCVTGNFDSNQCLVLETLDEAAQAKVPLNISSGFTIHDEGSGVLRLAVDGDGSRGGTAAVVDRQLRIGVGEDFQGNQYGSVPNPGNRPPVAKIDFSPGTPRTGDPITFSGSDSFDPDGDISTYQWDFDNDGVFDDLGETIDREFEPGDHKVALQVVDDDGSTSETSVTFQVSGLAYGNDLDDTSEGTGTGDAIHFSVTNEWDRDVSQSIEITHVLVNPTWTSSSFTVRNNCERVGDCPYNDNNYGEIIIDRGRDGGLAERSIDLADTEVPPDGMIVELEDPITLFSDESARIWAGEFEDFTELQGREFEVGVRYEVAGRRNSTVVTDVAGGMNVEEFRLERAGGRVDAVITTDKKIDTLEIELGGTLSGTEETPGTPTELSADRWRYRIDLGPVSEGVATANLTVAKNDSVSAFETRGSKSIDRSIVTLGGDYVWRDAGDWDASTDDGVVHDSYGNRSEDEVRLGYPHDGPGLAGYWHFDGSAEDISGNGRDGSVDGARPGYGLFGTRGYVFDGDDDTVEIDEMGDIHNEESSVSMWIKTTTPARYTYRWEHIPSIFGNDIWWGWIDTTGRIGIRTGGRAGPRSEVSVTDGQWHHVVLTLRDDGYAKIYVDGELSNDGWTSAPRYWWDDFSEVGEIEDFFTESNFEGRIDEVRSYDRVLDDDEVEELARKRGDLSTDWQTGSSLDLEDLRLQYGADIPPGTTINVTVEVDDGSVDRTSETITLTDGERSIPVESLGTGTADRYMLRIDFETQAAVKSPVLYKIGLTDDS